MWVRNVCHKFQFSVISIAQKMKFSINDLFIKCDQIRRTLRIWSHLLKKPVMENFIFCALIWLNFIEKSYSVLQFSWTRISVHPPIRSFIQFLWLNYSTKCLHTIYSSYSPLEKCFKTQRILTYFAQKSEAGSKITKNECSLSMVMSYTIGKPMKKMFFVPNNWSLTQKWAKIGVY